MARIAGTSDGDLASIVTSAKTGDELAFRRLVRDYHEDMRRVCCYVTRDATLAEEATQAAWAIAWRKVGSVREPARIRPWLVSVAVNEAKRLVRSQRRREHFEVVKELGDVSGGVDPETGISGIDLREALARLRPDERALLAMRYVAGFSSTELSQATGITPVGTRQRLRRLLSRLRSELRDA